MVDQVAVALPVRNGADLIRDSLDCIARQSHQDLDVVVFDNASDDATASIVRALGAVDPRIRLHSHEQNIGAVGNFRFGLQFASASHFLWRAYDDLSDDRFIESCLAALEAKPAAALAAPTVVLKKFGKGITRTRVPKAIPCSPEPTHAERRALLRHLEAGWIYGLFRREAIDETFGWVANRYPFTWAVDYLTLAVFALRHSIVPAPKAKLELRLTAALKKYSASEARAERVELVRCYWGVLNEALLEIPMGWLDRCLYRLTFIWHIQRRVAKWPVIIEAALAKGRE